jgi:hypothetical protein
MRLGLCLVAPFPQQFEEAGKIGVGNLLHRWVVRLLDQTLFVSAQRPRLFLA